MIYRQAIATGMRQGEILALRWQDIDMDAATITVRHTLSSTGRSVTPRPTAGGGPSCSTPTRRPSCAPIALVTAQERLAVGPRW